MSVIVDYYRQRENSPLGKTPIWFMRQAGRYLPEYKKIRASFSSFMEFVFTPEAAAEATLQPLKRFDLDAAIIFSDILVIPHALGQEVTFTPGVGPVMAPLAGPAQLSFTSFDQVIAPTTAAIARVRSTLDQNPQFHSKSLIGFSGAPWTLACYMLQGGGSKTFDAARKYAAAQPEAFKRLIELLTQACTRYLEAQITAGADVIKIFDSWAGLCPHWLRREALTCPVSTIINNIRARHSEVPIIYFPRGAGESYPEIYQQVRPDILAIDQFLDPDFIAQNLPKAVIQGGLDPMILYAGGSRLREQIKSLVDRFKNRPYIFNLGHGMIPEMPIDHVNEAIAIVRECDRET